jgi:hypothetical protein
MASENVKGSRCPLKINGHFRIFQVPKLEVPTIYKLIFKGNVRGYTMIYHDIPQNMTSYDNKVPPVWIRNVHFFCVKKMCPLGSRTTMVNYGTSGPIPVCWISTMTLAVTAQQFRVIESFLAFPTVNRVLIL